MIIPTNGTKGTTIEGGPTTYEIRTTCGRTFEVVKEMHKWICGGQSFHSIKEVKDSIKQDTIDTAADVDYEPDCPGCHDSRCGHTNTPRCQVYDADTVAEVVQSSELWHGVCPACYWIVTRPNDLEPLTRLEHAMLDNFGLITEDGEPDIEYATKEVDRATKAHSMINLT
jgi:hypothetical protein